MRLKITPLLEKVFETVEKIGVQNTYNTLELAQDRHSNTQSKIDFIINRTCERYKITRNELLNARTKNLRTEALAICFYIIHSKIKLKPSKIAKLFEKQPSMVGRGIKRITDLDANHPLEREIRDHVIIIVDAYDKEYAD